MLFRSPRQKAQLPGKKPAQGAAGNLRSCSVETPWKDSVRNLWSCSVEAPWKDSARNLWSCSVEAPWKDSVRNLPNCAENFRRKDSAGFPEKHLNQPESGSPNGSGDAPVVCPGNWAPESPAGCSADGL